jgi:16S rRNA (guanine(527)-N(7))-methyltransferase RsmG
MQNHHLESNFESVRWTNFITKYHLNSIQQTQFKEYLALLIEWNNKFNLTAITNPDEIIQYHFDDSLAITNVVDFNLIKTTADVGTGAGFPGMPIKIVFPHLRMVLIEVNNKKRAFLQHVAQELGLENIIIAEEDWRTFLRNARDMHEQDGENNSGIDYFFARASLQPEELLRVFKPSCIYQHSKMVYWASRQWRAEKRESPFVEKEIVYTLSNVERKLIFFTQITADHHRQ